jgi:thiamine kinase-like enzyme
MDDDISKYINLIEKISLKAYHSKPCKVKKFSSENNHVFILIFDKKYNIGQKILKLSKRNNSSLNNELKIIIKLHKSKFPVLKVDASHETINNINREFILMPRFGEMTLMEGGNKKIKWAQKHCLYFGEFISFLNQLNYKSQNNAVILDQRNRIGSVKEYLKSIPDVPAFYFNAIDHVENYFKKNPTIIGHNDLGPHQVLIDKNQMVIVDWEYFGNTYEYRDLATSVAGMIIWGNNSEYAKLIIRGFNNKLPIHEKEKEIIKNWFRFHFLSSSFTMHQWKKTKAVYRINQLIQKSDYENIFENL